jgi:hypothetical protein
LITPEHDQSRVTQCRVYEGIGEIIACHKSVKIVTIDTTKERVLTGEGILRKMFTRSMSDIKTIRTTITVVTAMGWELMDTSKIGLLARLPQMNSS